MRREMPFESRKFGIVWKDNDAVPVQSQNSRRSIESTKHDDNASVLPKMRRGFRSAARVILIRHFHRPEHSKRIAPLWRDVDMTVHSQRRSGHKEDALLCDPALKF